MLNMFVKTILSTCRSVKAAGVLDRTFTEKCVAAFIGLVIQAASVIYRHLICPPLGTVAKCPHMPPEIE